MSQHNTSSRYMPLMVALVALGIFGYPQPWLVASSGAMTLNAFDLAEWASLVPAQRGTNPPLVLPLFLRLQLLILSLLLAVIVSGRRKMLLAAAVICLIAAAQLPPVEFVYDINNLNYRQQFGLAAASLIGGFALLPLEHALSSRLLKLALAAAGIATASSGLAGSMTLYSQFGLAAATGAGIWILSFSYSAMIALTLLDLRTRRRARL